MIKKARHVRPTTAKIAIAALKFAKSARRGTKTSMASVSFKAAARGGNTQWPQACVANAMKLVCIALDPRPTTAIAVSRAFISKGIFAKNAQIIAKPACLIMTYALLARRDIS
jgi:hypothetical protein